jgi:hypothetical protein
VSRHVVVVGTTALTAAVRRGFECSPVAALRAGEIERGVENASHSRVNGLAISTPHSISLPARKGRPTGDPPCVSVSP